MRRLFAKPAPPAPLDVLRDTVITPRPFVAGEVVTDIWFHTDPAWQGQGTWASPRGRMLEVEVDVTTPGAWCALHLRLDLRPADHSYLGLIARTAADRAMITRVCLRAGHAEGFHDHFLPRDILSQPGASDHIDMMVPAQCPDLPRDAQWHELILFLPSRHSFAWGLHDLRVFGL